MFWGNFNAVIGERKRNEYDSNNNYYCVSDIKAKANKSNWELGGSFNHSWESGLFFSKLYYSGFRNSFYGANALASSSFPFEYRDVSCFGVKVGVTSFDAYSWGSKFNYNFIFFFFSAWDSFDINEGFFNNNGSIGPTFGKYS